MYHYLTSRFLKPIFRLGSDRVRHRLVRSVLLAAIAARAVGSGQAQDTLIWFRICNKSPRVIRQVFVSASDRPEWGQDMLAGQPLGANRSRTLQFSGSCLPSDLRLVSDGGVEYLEEEADFCPVGGGVFAFTVTDREITKAKATANTCGE
jgi:hypothetical protein